MSTPESPATAPASMALPHNNAAARPCGWCLSRLLPSALLAAAAVAGAPAWSAPPLELVSAAEMRASNDAPEPFGMKAIPVKDAPVIEVVSPSISGGVASPTPIEVSFKPIAPASVKPESFRVFYGALQIDITKRLLGVASVTPQGIQVKEAALPKGKHKLTMSVEDSSGRVGSQQIEFVVN